MTRLENQDLFIYKKNCLKTFKNDFKTYIWKNIFECCYLGQNIRFYHNSSLFEQSLKKILPDKWKVISSDSSTFVEIFIHNPDFFLCSVDWDDESSQDCLIINSKVYHRDFCAEIVSGKIHLIMLDEASLGDGFFNFLRWYLPREILKKNKIILHSSCVILNRDNKAYFFLGHSGAGKSTIADFAGSRKVLGDDMNLISFEKEYMFAQAGAIGGNFYPNVDYSRKYDIGGFFILSQSNENKVRPIDRSKAYLKIISSFANLFWEDLSASEKMKCFKLAKRLVHSFHFNILDFKKDKSIYEIIDG